MGIYRGVEEVLNEYNQQYSFILRKVPEQFDHSKTENDFKIS